MLTSKNSACLFFPILHNKQKAVDVMDKLLDSLDDFIFWLVPDWKWD